jgi:hypothetical protein
MSVSRRIFLSGSVATAIASVSASLEALVGGRPLPHDTGLANRNNASAGTIAEISAQQTVTPEQRYGGMAHLTRNSFAGAVGSTFKLTSTSGNSQSFWLRLLSVNDLSESPVTNPAAMAVLPPVAAQKIIRTSSFSLAFFGGPLPGVQQNTFFVEHPELGTFALFIVPAGPQQYTATVNRL